MKFLNSLWHTVVSWQQEATKWQQSTTFVKMKVLNSLPHSSLMPRGHKLVEYYFCLSETPQTDVSIVPLQQHGTEIKHNQAYFAKSKEKIWKINIQVKHTCLTNELPLPECVNEEFCGLPGRRRPFAAWLGTCGGSARRPRRTRPAATPPPRTLARSPRSPTCARKQICALWWTCKQSHKCKLPYTK